MEAAETREQQTAKKMESLNAELTMLAKCKNEQDQREQQIYAHAKNLVDIVEAQKQEIKDKMEECSRLERENAEFKLKELKAVGQQQQAKLEVL